MLGPYLLEINEVEIPVLSPEELDRRMQEAISKIHFTPVKKGDVDYTSLEGDSKGKRTKDHVDLLRIIATKWFIGENELSVEMGNIHPEYLGRLKRELFEMGLITESEFIGVGKGKPKKACFVTESGAELLGMDFAKCVPPGKGGIQHRYLQMLLKNALKNSVIEFMSGDVVQYHSDGSTTVYEIELNPADDHFLKNIEVDLPLFNRIVLVAKNPKDLKILKNKAEEHFQAYTLDSVEFKTIGELLK